MARFINLTNHPSARWSAEQTEAALAVAGTILDLPFPRVPVEADEGWLAAAASDLAEEVNADDVVCVQGDFTLTFSIVQVLKHRGILCVAAVTEREVQDTPRADGATVKHSVFRFGRFRPYPTLARHEYPLRREK